MQDTAPRSSRFQCVLVPFDFSEASHHALQVAAQFGHPAATLALLHAVEPDDGVSEHAQLHGQLVNTRVQEAQRQLEALARPLRAAWAEVQVLASLGDPKDVILSTAELVHADLGGDGLPRRHRLARAVRGYHLPCRPQAGLLGAGAAARAQGLTGARHRACAPGRWEETQAGSAGRKP